MIKYKTLGKTQVNSISYKKDLHKNCNNFKSYNEFPLDDNKTPIATPALQEKRAILVAEDFMLHEIDENKISGTKRNSVNARIFRGATIDYMKNFLKANLKRAPTNM